jgi:hypothetical protein
VILADPSSYGDLDIFLPDANVHLGQRMTIKKISTGHKVTLSSNDMIDEGRQLELHANALGVADLVSSVRGWHILHSSDANVLMGTSASNLISWIKFDGLSDNVLIDSSDSDIEGYSNFNITAQSITGSSNQALQFNGTDEQAMIPDHAYWDFGQGDYSLSFWAKFPFSNAPHWSSLLGKGSSSSVISNTFGILQKSGTNDQISFYEATDAGGAFSTIIHSPSIPSGWRHIAAIRSSGNLFLYIDASLVGSSGNPSIPNLSNDYPWNIGNSYSQNQYLAFAMDDMRIYNKGLTVQEVQSIFQKLD